MSSKHGVSVVRTVCAICDNLSAPKDAPSQLQLRYNDRFLNSEAWDELHDELTAVVSALGLKQVAFDLDEQPSAVAHAFADRERHSVKAKWIPYLVKSSPNDRIVQVQAAWRGPETRLAHEMTPTEKLERITASLERSPLIAEAIYRDAFGPKGKP